LFRFLESRQSNLRLTAPSLHFTDSAVMIPRPHERGDGRWDGGEVSRARHVLNLRRVALWFFLPTRARQLWSASLRHEKIHPRSVINVFSTVRPVTVEGFRLQHGFHQELHIVAVWGSPVLRIWKIEDSNLVPEAGYPGLGFSLLSWVPPATFYHTTVKHTTTAFLSILPNPPFLIIPSSQRCIVCTSEEESLNKKK
jgi:hypothetical protein